MAECPDLEAHTQTPPDAPGSTWTYKAGVLDSRSLDQIQFQLSQNPEGFVSMIQ